MKFILACDESGAKGYADQDEQFPGQIGVFAGLLVPDQILAQVEAALEQQSRRIAEVTVSYTSRT